MPRAVSALATMMLGAAASVAGEIPANTWVGAGVKHVAPAHIKDAQWQTTDGYCGSVYRSKANAIVSRTGIRSKQLGLSPGFYSNTTLEWDLAKGIARAIDVANWGGGSYGGGEMRPGFKDRPTPTPRHTYDGITYVEEEDSMYLILGANWRMGSKAGEEAKAQLALDNRSTWKYTFADGRWNRIDDSIRRFWNPNRASPYEAHLQHWPEGKRLLFFDSRGACYAEFDLAAQRWEKVDLAGKAPMSFYNARSTWDSKRSLWVFRLGPKACTFDPKTKSFQPLPDSGLDGEDKSKGVAYVAKHDVYLTTGPTGNDTWVYSPAAGKWSAVQGGAIKLVNGYLQYDPKTDLAGLVYQLKAFVFRYVPEK